MFRNESRISQVAHQELWWSEFQKRSVQPGAVTHTTCGMNGILIVPYPQIPLFRKAFLQDILEGNLHYYCEFGVKDDQCIFLTFDLDIESTDEPDMWIGVRRMIQVVLETVREFFKERVSLRCLVCLSLPYIKKRDGINYNHWGVHMYFYELIVNKRVFIIIRDHVIHRLKSQMGPRAPPNRNKWEQVVDGGVIGTGLRLIFARKPQVCPYLPLKAKRCRFQSCSLCNSSKGIPSPSIYMPYLAFENSQMDLVLTRRIHSWQTLEQKAKIQHWEKIIQCCTIRPYFPDRSLDDIQVSEDFILPVDVGLRPCVQKQLLEEDVTIPSFGNKNQKKKSGIEFYNAHAEVYKIIPNLWKDETFLENLNEFHRQQMEFISIEMSKGRDSLTLKTSCRYCLNIGKFHKGCKIYFVINQMKKKRKQSNTKNPIFYLQQLCFCKNFCAGYRSDAVEIPDHFARLLFPKIFTISNQDEGTTSSQQNQKKKKINPKTLENQLYEPPQCLSQTQITLFEKKNVTKIFNSGKENDTPTISSRPKSYPRITQLQAFRNVMAQKSQEGVKTSKTKEK